MKLNYRQTFLVGLAFFAISAFWQVYDGIIPLILKETFGVGDTLAGAVMAADNVLAIFMLPLFGILSDHTQGSLGRRMPYILVGTAAACILLLLVPLANALKSLPLFFFGLGAVLVAMSTFRSPAVALMPDVTPKPLRSRGNAVINLMGALGGILALAMVALLVPPGENPNYFPVFLGVILLMAASAAAMWRWVDEPAMARAMEEQSRAMGLEPEEKAPPRKKLWVRIPHQPLDPQVRRSMAFLLLAVFLWFMGYNAVTTAFSRYARLYWGMEGGSYAYSLMVAQGAAILAFLPAGWLAARLGRKKTIVAGVFLLAAAFGAVIFFRSFSQVILVFFALAGVGWAAINVNSYPMVVEMAGEGSVGRFTGYYYIASSAAQIITPILSGAVLEHLGYPFLFPYATLFSVLALLAILRVGHGDIDPHGLPALPPAEEE